MDTPIRIGTRNSQLARWQAEHVADILQAHGHITQLVPISSQGDLDLSTPLYAMGVEGVFTRHLDAALLAGQIDIAVHSMKDVPTVLAQGLVQAAVLQRGPVKDLLVYRYSDAFLSAPDRSCTIATGSIRRRAQWLHRYPNSTLTGLRGNVNTRLAKLAGSDWDGALFAAAGLERIGLRPERSVELPWMLPAPAQGAILVACKATDTASKAHCRVLHDPDTALCVKLERDFLRTLHGGCSTPISALAELRDGNVIFQGNVLSPDGRQKAAITKEAPVASAASLGVRAAAQLLQDGGQPIVDQLKRSPDPES